MIPIIRDDMSVPVNHEHRDRAVLTAKLPRSGSLQQSPLSFENLTIAKLVRILAPFVSAGYSLLCALNIQFDFVLPHKLAAAQIKISAFQDLRVFK